MGERLFKPELSKWLRVPVRTIENWTLDQRFEIPFTKQETGYRRPMFEPVEIAEWIVAMRDHVDFELEVAEVLEGEALITKRELANRLRLAPGSVIRLRSEGAIPAIVFRHNLIRFHPVDIAHYIKANKNWADPNRYGEIAEAIVYAELRAAMGTRFAEGRQLLTLAEVGQWLGLGSWSVRSLCDDGYLPRVQLPPLDVVRYDAYDVQELIDRRRPQRRAAWAEFPLEPTS